MKNFLILFATLLSLALVSIEVKCQKDAVYYSSYYSKDFPVISLYTRLNKSVLPTDLSTQFFYRSINIIDNDQNCEVLEVSNYVPFDTLNVRFIYTGYMNELDLIRFNSAFETLKDDSTFYYKSYWYDHLLNKITFNIASSYRETKDDKPDIPISTLNEFLGHLDLRTTQAELIVFIGDGGLNIPELILNILKETNEKDQLLFALYTPEDKKKKDKEIDKYISSNRKIVKDRFIIFESTFGNNFEENLKNSFYRYLSSFIRVKFKVNQVLKLQYDYNYKLNIQSGDTLVSDTIHINVPDSLVNNQFVIDMASKGINLAKNSEFEKSLFLLQDAYTLIPADRLRDTAQKVLVLFSEDILKKKGLPYQLFHAAEKVWDFDSKKDQQYAELKTTLLDTYYDSFEMKPSNYDSLYRINRLRLEVNPNSTKYKLNNYYLRAERHIIRGNKLQAIHAYYKYLSTKNDKTVNNKFLTVLNELMAEDFNNKKYKEVYNLGDQYFSYIKDSFENRYYYASSCYKLKNYDIALTGYEWMVDHWNDNQKLLTWDETFFMLESLYSATYHFDEAMDLNKRHYRKHKEVKYLNSYIKNLRLKFLKPIVDAFPVLMNSISASEDLKTVKGNLYRTNPYFLHRIFIVDTVNNREINLMGSSNINLSIDEMLNDIVMFPAIMQKDNICWFINNDKKRRLVIIEFDLKVNAEEDIIVIKINGAPTLVEPWKNLYESECIDLLKYNAAIISALVATDIKYGYSGDIQPYWNQIKSNQYVKYIVKHNDEGEIIKQIKFDKSKADFDPLTWEKSSITNLIYITNINYDNEEIIDIVNPLLNGANYKGSLRIGFYY